MKYVYLNSLGIQKCEIIERFKDDSNVRLLEPKGKKSKFKNSEIFDSPEEVEIYQYKTNLKKYIFSIDEHNERIEKLKKIIKDSKTPRIKELIKKYPERFIL